MAKFDSVVVEPVPVIAPGLIVQIPVGKTLNITLPVETAQLGCVIVPTIGDVGVDGCAFTVTLVAVDIQLLSVVLLTKILCGPDAIPAKIVED